MADPDKVSGGPDDIGSKISDMVDLSPASISQLGESISGSLEKALQTLLPRILDYASGLFGEMAGVGFLSDSAFSRSAGIMSATGYANSAAAMGSGMLDKESYIMQYAKSVGIEANDYPTAEGRLRSAGMLDSALELASTAAAKGVSGGLDPNATLSDFSFDARMQLFNESIGKARNEAKSGAFSDLFKGMDVDNMDFSQIQSVVEGEHRKLDNVLNNPNDYKKEEVEAAKQRKDALNKSNLTLAIGDAQQFGNLDPAAGISEENQRRIAELASKKASLAVFDPQGLRKSISDDMALEHLENARASAVSEFGDLFKGKDVGKMSAFQIQKVLDTEANRIASDKKMSEEEKSSKLAALRESDTLRSTVDSMEFAGRRPMSEKNAATLDEAVAASEIRQPGIADAVRRRELAGGFGMLVNQAAFGPDSAEYTDPNKAVGAMHAIVQAAGGMDQAKLLMANWAGSNQFDEDVDKAFAGDEDRRDLLLRKLGDKNAKVAEAARSEIVKRVVEYTNEHEGDSTGLGRALGIRQQAMATFGGNEEEAGTALNVLSAAFGVTSRGGMTQEASDYQSRVLEYLRQTAQGSDEFVSRLGQVKQSLDELGIETTDVNGNPTKLAAQLTAASLGIDIGLRKSGVGDENVARSAANEFARDFADSRETKALGSLVGAASMLKDENGNQLISQKQIENFALGVARDNLSVKEMEERAKQVFGAENFSLIKTAISSDSGIKKKMTELGQGMLGNIEGFNKTMWDNALHGSFSQQLQNFARAGKQNGLDLFSGESSQQNLEDLKKTGGFWKQVSSAFGGEKQAEAKFKQFAEDKTKLSKYDRDLIETLSRGDYTNPKTAKYLNSLAATGVFGTEMAYNVGGTTRDGQSAADAVLDLHNNGEMMELDIDNGTTPAAKKAAKAGANTDRLSADPANIAAAQRATDEMRQAESAVNMANKIADMGNEGLAKVGAKLDEATGRTPKAEDDEDKKSKKNKKKDEPKLGPVEEDGELSGLLFTEKARVEKANLPAAVPKEEELYQNWLAKNLDLISAVSNLDIAKINSQDFSVFDGLTEEQRAWAIKNADKLQDLGIDEDRLSELISGQSQKPESNISAVANPKEEGEGGGGGPPNKEDFLGPALRHCADEVHALTSAITEYLKGLRQ